MAEFHQGLYLIPPEDIATGGVTNEMARRWNVLQNLQVHLQALARHAAAPHKHASRPAMEWDISS